MEDYQEIKLDKFREVWSISIFFLTFFGGRFYLTNEFCHFVKIRQQKVKIRTSHLNEYDYQIYWLKKYIWRTIKIE